MKRFHPDFSAFITGFILLCAQTVLFRVFYSAFDGNELSIPLFISSWLIWFAIGTIPGKLIARFKKCGTFSAFLLLLLSGPALILQFHLISLTRDFAELPSFEVFPLSKLLITGFLCNSILPLLAGLFLPSISKESNNVAQNFAFECLGGFAGAVFSIFLLGFGFQHTGVLLISASISSACALIYAFGVNHPLPLFGAAFLLGLPLLTDVDKTLYQYHNSKQWQSLLQTPGSPQSFTTDSAQYLYGNLGDYFLVLNSGGVQEMIPDEQRAAEVTAAHLTQRPHSKSVLLYGNMGVSLIQAMQSLVSDSNITWLNGDPELPSTLLSRFHFKLPHQSRIYTPEKTLAQWANSHSSKNTDLILVQLPDSPDPAKLSCVKKQFLLQLKSHLAADGVLSFRITGAEGKLSPAQQNLGAILIENLQSVFAEITVKPGTESWIMASDQPFIEKPQRLIQNWISIKNAPSLLPAEKIKDIYDENLARYQKHAYSNYKADSSYISLIQDPEFNSHSLFKFLNSIRFLSPLSLLGALLPLLLMRFILLRRSTPGARNSSLFEPVLAILTISFCSSGIHLILLHKYETCFGSIYLHLGLLSSLFLCGIALGYILIKLLPARYLQAGFILILFFCSTLASVVSLMNSSTPAVLFWLVALFCGTCCGLGATAATKSIACITGTDPSFSLWFTDTLGGLLGILTAGFVLMFLWNPEEILFFLGAIPLFILPLYLYRKQYQPSNGKRKWGFAIILILMAVAFSPHFSSLISRLSTGVNHKAVFLTKVKHHFQESFPIQWITHHNTPIYYCETKNKELIFSTRHLYKIDGYGGKVSLLVKITEDGKLLDFQFLEDTETPSYLTHLGSWFNTLKKSYPHKTKVDTVSGATLTSNAVLQILKHSIPQFLALKNNTSAEAETMSLKIPPLWILVILMACGTIGLRKTPQFRIWAMMFTMCCFGLYFNFQYSSPDILSFFSMKALPNPFSIPSLKLLWIPLIILLTGNIYCGWLCPFGALQEILYSLRQYLFPFKAVSVDFNLEMRWIKYLLLILLLLPYPLSQNIINTDPLVSFFSGNIPETTILLLFLLLICGLVYPRFWCRFLCPTGAALSILSSLKLGKRFGKIHLKQCDLGVNDAGILDCIHCYRCKNHKNSNSATKSKILLLLVFICSVLLLLGNSGYSANEITADSQMHSKVKGPSNNEIEKAIQKGEISSQEAHHWHTAH